MLQMGCLVENILETISHDVIEYEFLYSDNTIRIPIYHHREHTLLYKYVHYKLLTNVATE